MTATDARPPSDETPATDEAEHEHGWRQQPDATFVCGTCGAPGRLAAAAWNEGARAADEWHQGGQLLAEMPENPYGPTPRPVLVVDPAEAREKIARALHQHDEVLRHIPWDGLLSDERAMYLAAADAAIAALTTQEPTTEPPPRVEDIVDGWVKPGGGPT